MHTFLEILLRQRWWLYFCWAFGYTTAHPNKQIGGPWIWFLSVRIHNCPSYQTNWRSMDLVLERSDTQLPILPNKLAVHGFGSWAFGYTTPHPTKQIGSPWIWFLSVRIHNSPSYQTNWRSMDLVLERSDTQLPILPNKLAVHGFGSWAFGYTTPHPTKQIGGPWIWFLAHSLTQQTEKEYL